MPRHPLPPRDDLRAAALRRGRPPKRLPRMLQPDGIRLRYFGRLVKGPLALIRELLGRKLLSQLPRLVANAAHARGAKLDAADSELGDILDEIADDVFERWTRDQIAKLVQPVARQTLDFSRDQLNRQLSAALGIDVIQAEPWAAPMIQQFTSENVALIKRMTQDTLADIEAKVGGAIADGVRHEEIAELVEDRFGVGESRAKLIARDQTGKFFGDLNRVRQEDLGINGYIWRGMNDNREREEHIDREGEHFDWNDPPEDGNPGEPVQCRCYAEPDLGPLFGELGVDDSAPADDS